MKIGIVTLNGYFNYGNRLQNYALQQVLRNEGHKVETVVFESEETRKSSNKIRKVRLIDRVLNLKNKSISDIIKKIQSDIKNKIYGKKYKHLNHQREEIFKDFTKKNIIERHIKISNNQIPHEFIKEYDYFITGSDQVWNPNYNKGSQLNFLTFFDGSHSIAFAPSFGVSQIPVEYQENYKSWISDIKYLSVRENEGAKIIRELTGRNAPILVDPTLLLTSEQWRELEDEVTVQQNKRYLLTYFLGETRVKYRKVIESYAKANSLEIINLSDINEEDSYVAGPKEFIYYIDNCDLFCTDSFHGTVFSIIFKKPFVVFERVGTASMYSRIETILDKFNLTSRKDSNISLSDVMDIDYSNVAPILEAERQKAIEFLRNSLNVKDE
jgi:hypothetical protein